MTDPTIQTLKYVVNSYPRSGLVAHGSLSAGTDPTARIYYYNMIQFHNILTFYSAYSNLRNFGSFYTVLLFICLCLFIEHRGFWLHIADCSRI